MCSRDIVMLQARAALHSSSRRHGVIPGMRTLIAIVSTVTSASVLQWCSLLYVLTCWEPTLLYEQRVVSMVTKIDFNDIVIADEWSLVWCMWSACYHVTVNSLVSVWHSLCALIVSLKLLFFCCAGVSARVPEKETGEHSWIRISWHQLVIGQHSHPT